MYQLLDNLLALAGIILLVFVWKNFRAKKGIKRPRRTALFICAGVICLVLSFIPIENGYRADSPEEVFEQVSSKDILNTIYGDDSCMVVAVDYVGNYEYKCIARDEDGYMIPGTSTSKEVFSAPAGYPGFDVKLVSGTSDYYLSGIGAYSTDTLTVTDSLGSQFYVINATSEDGIENGTAIYLYYAHLDSFDENYCITINGQSFCVGDME